VIPSFKVKPNTHSMCAQESCFYTYRKKWMQINQCHMLGLNSRGLLSPKHEGMRRECESGESVKVGRTRLYNRCLACSREGELVSTRPGECCPPRAS
jgi:hypothetical protein